MAIGKILKYGIKAVKSARKAKKPKRSFKSMNPVEKAFTAAKITGRGMNTFTSKGRFAKADRRFINTLYGVAGASQLIPAVRKKKK
jgi:hypothetical protein